jgi:hypothetical protein
MRAQGPGERRIHPSPRARGLKGALTVVAFTDSGRMHRMRVSRRLLFGAALLLLVLTVGSSTSVLRLFRGHVDLARMAYLEQENKALASLLENQAEQLSRLKLEVGRLKDFEQNLRVVSGIDAKPDPAVGTEPSQPAVEKKRRPRKP